MRKRLRLVCGALCLLGHALLVLHALTQSTICLVGYTLLLGATLAQAVSPFTRHRQPQ